MWENFQSKVRKELKKVEQRVGPSNLRDYYWNEFARYAMQDSHRQKSWNSKILLILLSIQSHTLPRMMFTFQKLRTRYSSETDYSIMVKNLSTVMR